MKKQILLLLFISISSIIRSQSINDHYIAISGYVNLVGKWKSENIPDKENRSLAEIPIAAIIENGIISIDIWDTVDNITVNICSEYGSAIYSGSFWINESLQYSININGYLKGNYLLEISNKNKGYVCGWFKIE